MDSFVVLPRHQVINFLNQVKLVTGNFRLFIPEGCIPNTCIAAQTLIDRCDDYLLSLSSSDDVCTLTPDLTTFLEDYLTLSSTPISLIAEQPEVFGRFIADLSRRAQEMHTLLSC